MMAYAFNHSTWEIEDLSKLQASHVSMVRPCLKVCEGIQILNDRMTPRC